MTLFGVPFKNAAILSTVCDQNACTRIRHQSELLTHLQLATWLYSVNKCDLVRKPEKLTPLYVEPAAVRLRQLE